MINVYLFNHKADEHTFSVFTADEARQEIYSQLPPAFIGYETRWKGEAESVIYRTFELKPNKYFFHFELLYEKLDAEKVDVLMKYKLVRM